MVLMVAALDIDLLVHIRTNIQSMRAVPVVSVCLFSLAPPCSVGMFCRWWISGFAMKNFSKGDFQFKAYLGVRLLRYTAAFPISGHRKFGRFPTIAFIFSFITPPVRSAPPF